jgi:DNA-binding transcriptional LysR family regulator
MSHGLPGETGSPVANTTDLSFQAQGATARPKPAAARRPAPIGFELRELRYFVAVAEELHFGRAAVWLHVAQPSLSKAIKELEAKLGIQLFIRGSRGVELTAAGRVLLEHARVLLSRAHIAAAAVEEHVQPSRVRLRLGIFSAGAAELTGPMIRAFRDRRPDVSLEFRALNLLEQHELLANGTIDVGLIRPPIGDERVEVHVLALEPRVVLLPADHRLARASSIALPDLEDERWLRKPLADAAFRRFWEVDPGSAGPGQEVTDPTEVRAAVAYAGNVALAPASAGRAFPYPGVRVVPLRRDRGCQLAVAHARDDGRRVVRDFLAVALETRRSSLGLVPRARAFDSGAREAA